MTTPIIGLLISMLFSAFFSGMEIAFVSSNRLRAEMNREKNGLSQRAIDFFYQHPNNFVSTMLVGNNIALVIYGILFAQIFDATLFASLPDGARVTADTLLSTLVVLFTGEFLPKTIFKSNPNGMLTFFALPAWLCYFILYPISRLATLLSKGLLRLVGVRMNKENEDKEFTRVDLDYLVQSSIDSAEDEDDIEEMRLLINDKNSFGLEDLMRRYDIDEKLSKIIVNLPTLFGPPEKIGEFKALTDNRDAIASIERLEKIYDLLKLYGYERYISFDLGMLSKYRYYTGIIFNAYTYGTGDAIISGGRYDNLVGQFDKPAPAIGMAVVVDRMMAALMRQGIGPDAEEKVKVFEADKSGYEAELKKAIEARKAGIPAKILIRH